MRFPPIIEAVIDEACVTAGEEWTMFQRAKIIFVIAVLCLYGNTPAQAEPKTDADLQATKQHSAKLNLGMGSTAGFIGFSYGYMPTGSFELEASAGAGYTGFQASIMPKIVFGDFHRLVLGVGATLGIPWNKTRNRNSVSGWLATEIGYEYHGETGLVVLLAAGVTVGLAGQYDSCLFGDCLTSQADVAGIVYPHFRTGIGFDF